MATTKPALSTVMYNGHELPVVCIGNDVLDDCDCGSRAAEYAVADSNGYATGCRDCATDELQRLVNDGTIEIGKA